MGRPVDGAIDTRAALLEAAIEVIEEAGDSGFRISAVLDRVGVASTAIYHHFGSRDDLIDSANAERYLRTLYVPNHDRIVAAVATSTTLEDFDAAVVEMLLAGRGSDGAHRRRTRIAVLGSAVSRPSLATKVAEVNAAYAQAMAAAWGPAQARGWMRADVDFQALAMWVIGASTGRFMIEIGGPIVDTDEWSRVEAIAMLAVVKGSTPGEGTLAF